MGLQNIPGGASAAQQTVVINNNFKRLDGESVTKLYKDTNGIPTILIGQDSSNKSVIKVAKAGIDVTKATDDQLIFNSQQNILKIIKIIPQTYTFTKTGGSGTSALYQVDTPHGLSFTPNISSTIVFDAALQAAVGSGGANKISPALGYGSVGAYLLLFVIAEVSVNATNVSLTIQTSDSLPAGTYTVNSKTLLNQETFV